MKRVKSELAMEKYKEYKDSGVQWLGEIPSHWKVRKMKYTFIERSEKNHPYEEPLCATQSKGVIPQSLYEGRVVVVNKGFEGLKLVKIGDFVISLRSFQGGIEYAYYQGIISAAYTVLQPKDSYMSPFFKYLFKSHDYIQLLQTCVTGIREGQNINYPLLSKKAIPLPPLAEQHSIVTYLDTKCSLLDTLLSNKEKQISLLQEMKQRVIADAVTRGVNPNVKFKATNIPWLPEIPEHWKMSKVSSHFRQRNVKVSDKEYPALSVSKMGVTPQLDNVALSNAEGNSRKLVKVGDYAVNSRSDRKGSCGVSQYEGSVSLITIVLEPFDIDRGYVHYIFRSNPWIEEFYRNGRGIVADLWTTNYQMMKGMYLPVPPLSEQRAIVSYITERTSKIDTLIEKLTKEIECVKEYKQRLISDVVTGQVKVS